MTVDHQDRYESLDEYVAAKQRIFENQTASIFPCSILTMTASPRCDSASVRNVWGSRPDRRSASDVSGGTYLEDDRIVTTVTGIRQEICRRSEIRIIGHHNVENVMAAVTYAVLCGCSLDAIRRVLATFPGLEHALEIVRERRGVRFVNDSKGTNVDATLKALESIDQPIWLIAGGRDKGGDFSRLAQAIRQRVKRAHSDRRGGAAIATGLGGCRHVTEAATLRDAVELAAREAQPGEVVLLSPACASFDMFADYQDRAGNSRHWFMPSGVTVQGEGGATLNDGTAITLGLWLSLVPRQPTIGQATRGGGPDALGGHHDPGAGGTRHGVQRECHRGGQPVSRSWVFPETAIGLAGVRLLVMHLVSQIDYTFWRKLSDSDVGLTMVLLL